MEIKALEIEETEILAEAFADPEIAVDSVTTQVHSDTPHIRRCC